MTTDQLVDQALASSDPVRELRTIIVRLNAEGLPNDTILAHLERRRQVFRSTGREREEDAVMDVMDFVNGWCSPHMKLHLHPTPAGNGTAANRSARQPLPPTETATGQAADPQNTRPEK